MKKLLLGAVVAVCVLAQPVAYSRQMQSADDIVARMQSQLNLTDQQITAVKPVIEEYISKRRQAMQDMRQSGDREAARSQMHQLRDDEEQKLGQILTPDQMTQWKSMHEGRRHGGHRQNRTPD